MKYRPLLTRAQKMTPLKYLFKLGSIRDRMCATAKIALNPEIIAFQ